MTILYNIYEWSSYPSHTQKMVLGIFALYMYVQNQFPFLFAQYVKDKRFYASNVIHNLNKHVLYAKNFCLLCKRCEDKFQNQR